MFEPTLSCQRHISSRIQNRPTVFLKHKKQTFLKQALLSRRPSIGRSILLKKNHYANLCLLLYLSKLYEQFLLQLLSTSLSISLFMTSGVGVMDHKGASWQEFECYGHQNLLYEQPWLSTCLFKTSSSLLRWPPSKKSGVGVLVDMWSLFMRWVGMLRLRKSVLIINDFC